MELWVRFPSATSQVPEKRPRWRVAWSNALPALGARDDPEAWAELRSEERRSVGEERGREKFHSKGN